MHHIGPFAAHSKAINEDAFRLPCPLHRFDLDDTAAAHDAVERATVGKVLVALAEAAR